jgi:hypothetical protein
MGGAHAMTSARDLRAFYERLHWGAAAPRDLSRWFAPDPRGGAVELGALVAVEYATAKGSRPVEVYRHEFDAGRLPLLGVTKDGPAGRGRGGLVIVGGGYVVTTEGIKG